MNLLRIAAATAGALLLHSVSATAAAAEAPLACDDADAVHAYWRPGIEAFSKGDLTTAKRVTDAIIAACGEQPNSWHPRVMRARIALQEKDYDAGLAALAPVPKPAPEPIGSYGSWTELELLAAKGDVEGFARARDALARAVDAALTDSAGAYRGRRLETFEIKGFTVTAYDVTVPQGPFVRKSVLLAVPTTPLAAPASVLLTTYGDDAPSIMKGVWIVDGYRCAGHSTITMLKGKPAAKKLRELATGWLEGANDGVSGLANNGQGCAFPAYITPGLD